MKLLAYLGLAVAFISFLGIPTPWKTFLFFVIGITIFVRAYLMHRSEKTKIGSSFKQNDYVSEKPLETEIMEIKEDKLLE